MMSLDFSSRRFNAIALAPLLALGFACGPGFDQPEVGDTTTTTADDDDDTSTTDDPLPPDPPEEPTEPDLPPETPIDCTPEANDLQLEWTETDPAAERAGAVAIGNGAVAWTTSDINRTQLRVLDPEGALLWEQTVDDTLLGEAELPFQDVAVDPEGNVALATTASSPTGSDGMLHWYDHQGTLLGTHMYTAESFNRWQGVAFLDDGEVVAVGESGDELLTLRYGPGAAPRWTETFGGPGSLWGSDVAITPSGQILASGHSNAIPGPVLVSFDGEGQVTWSHLDGDGSELDIAMSVVADDQDRAWMTVNEDSDGGRVERFDAAGNLEAALPLDFVPNAIAISPSGSIVVAGMILDQELVVVESRTPEWELLHRYERQGRWAMGIAVDDECHSYLAGSDLGGGAWLEKLR